jgi:hypothetical protein
VPDLDVPAAERGGDGIGTLIEAPWAHDEPTGVDIAALGIGYAVCAVDVRGVFAVLCYRRVSDGLSIDELEVEAPLAAVPVQRGVARVKPGAPLFAPAPAAIRVGASGAPGELVAAPAAVALEERQLETAPLRLRRSAEGSVQAIRATS